MSCLAVSDDCIVIAKGLQVDYYNYSSHAEFTVPSKSQETDVISDIVISANGKHLALITSTSKQLLVYDLPMTDNYRSYVLPRSASKIRFTVSNQQILVADKSGDVLLYNIKDDDGGNKLLGHLSLLLDVLQTHDEKYIITSDRDEKIKVSCYPNTYNIQTYCLGHKEFVNHIELLPHNPSYLTSTSGDGQLKCWDYNNGKLCYSIDTFIDVNDSDLKDNFTKRMDNEGIEVNNLPIVHYAVAKLNESSSLLAVAVHNYNKLLIYALKTDNNEFSHNLLQKFELESFPKAIKCHNSSLFTYNSTGSSVSIFKILLENGTASLKLDKEIKMFINTSTTDIIEHNEESIKVLYKRKFDNVQEYQERKKQRLEKSIQ
ncbi:tRNA (guanine-N(7)-)-methyltransferase non-catalytic subunit wuho [Pectinophora gossypiella]|uniref:tRNA (guanine-N(7)-)-methyltransferase non-catalytic subunit wuho n=1 Tax=Pectinophora gossypiella TaxID=13191 RepID=UPI00214ED239|nr:tRNA (guanine-N(7)-)-methyltransferase non-catalytic subunit wuho [Pectinophora gossypiella]